MTYLLKMISILPWDFADYWADLFQWMLLAALLLFSNTLRRKVKFIQKLLIPTPIIAGFLGLGLKYLLNDGFNIQLEGNYLITSEFMSVITYHTLAIGFIALGLKGSEKLAQAHQIKQVNPLKSGLFIVTTYMLQGILGLIITIIASFIFISIAPYSGTLLPMGFGQGPGQANNIGLLFESVGFNHGQSFGLSVSTMGFIAAAIGGVFYLNILRRKGKIQFAQRTDENKPQVTSIVEGSDEIPVVESVDKMSIQVSLVIFVYLLSWLLMFGITKLLTMIDSNPTGFINKSLIPIIWGFNFIFATLMTMLFKRVVVWIKKMKLMKRTYTNDFMLNRIAGFVFDFMIISSIVAIDLTMFNDVGILVTLAVLGIAGTVFTYIYCSHIAKRVYPEYEDASFLAFYGNLTGTISTGISILRELDPNFETPASNDLVVGASTAIIFGFPLILITGVIYINDWWLYGSLVALIVLFLGLYFFLIKKPSLKKEKAVNKTMNN